MSESMGKFVCKGSPCSTAQECIAEGKCLYRSSADILYEERRKTLELEGGMTEKAELKAEEFSGVADGKGIKMSMASPKSGVQMIDPAFILGIGDVLTYGAGKYTKNNWMRGMNWSEPFGAALRHLGLWFLGEERDRESGLSHLYHAACSIMFLAYYNRKEEHKQFDDRVFGGTDVR